MNKKLLIICAGSYGLAAKETAELMGCFRKIDFLDDNIKELPDGSKVIGVINDYENYILEYSRIFVAIENPQARLGLLNKIKNTTPYIIETLISPKAYISPSAQIMRGSLVEAMAVVNTGSVISAGCFIGAGSIVNHSTICCDGVHIECNAAVADHTLVPAGTLIESGTVYKKTSADASDFCFETEV